MARLKLSKAAGLKNQQRNRSVNNGRVQIASDIRITEKQHEELLKYLTERLGLAKEMRSQYIDVFRHIDREYYGYLRRDHEDKKRSRDNELGKGVKPTDEKLSLIFSQLDEAQTYLLTVLAPDEAIYSAVAPVAQQDVAKGFTTLMNQHAERFKHYRNYAIFILDALKYNFGAFGVYWREQKGNVVGNDPTSGTPVTTKRVVYQGNEVIAHDPYNTLLDPSVSPVDVSALGEYFATVEMRQSFRLKVLEKAGELYQVDKFLKTQPQMNYFETHPQTRDDFSQLSDSAGSDWAAILSAHTQSQDSDTGKMYEIIPMYCWIVPKDLGLGESEEYEIWRFILGSDKYVLHAQHMENAHGLLPINVAMPFEDHFKWQARGAAERLVPYQRFGSFIFNVHQRATRKRLYGLTVYDKNAIPLMEQDDVDMTGGKIPANVSGADVDLRKKIVQFTDGPDTTNTLQNIDLMNKIMQSVLPTNVLQQVAGLERATQYQSAAVVQSANRRNLKIAKVINAQAMDSGRTMQYHNIMQYQEALTILAPGGEEISISPAALRDTHLEFTISDGLKGIDRLSLVMNIKEVLNAVLQSQQAAQQLDIVGVIDYWTSLLGDYTDFKQFKITSPLDKLPADQRNMAFQLLQRAMQQMAQQDENADGRSGQQGNAGNTTPRQ